VHLTSQVLESSNHEQGPFLTFLGFSGSTYLPHEICNSRATLDLFKWIFWGLLGKVLRIIHASFRQVSLRFDLVLVQFLECLRAVFRFLFRVFAGCGQDSQVFCPNPSKLTVRFALFFCCVTFLSGCFGRSFVRSP